MRFIDVPNLPEGPVGLVVVDGRVSAEVEAGFEKLNISIIRTERYPDLYEAISYHPDIFLHHTGGDSIIYAPETDPRVLVKLSGHGFRLVRGDTHLSAKYPLDIAYNVARIGRYYFHNLKYTDPVLRKALDDQGLEPIDIKQGYAKCSISVVGENSIITSDAGIARVAGRKGLDVLFLEQRQGILLPGLDYGFIGGSTGLIGEKQWAICGDVGKLASNSDISRFLAEKNIEIISITGGNVTDIGSILPLKTFR